MVNTDITLINDGGVLVPSAASVPAVSGDTVSFSISGGEPAFLFFSPEATTILAPRPVNPVQVSGSDKTAFSFTSSKSGAYSVFVATDANTGPKHFPQDISNKLMLEIGSVTQPPPPFSGPHDTTTPGS